VGPGPPGVFARAGDPAGVRAVAGRIGPAKAEAVRRWHALRSDATQN